jgi:perosamine synthetase
LQYYRERYDNPAGSFPIAEAIAARTITLPFFPGITRDEVARAVAALRRALETTR